MADIEKQEQDGSSFHLHGIGVVVEDRPDGDDPVIIVNLVEKLTLQTGPMNSESESETVDITLAGGIKSKAIVSGSRLIRPRWVPEGDANRMTPPDVRVGESVKIYRNSDESEYFWSTVFIEPILRRLEHVIWGFGNTRNKGERLSKQNTYYAEWNTKDKVVNFVTTMSDGERYSYHFSLDPGNSGAFLRDNIGNGITISSDEASVTVTDSEGGIVELKAGFATITAPAGYRVKAPKITLDGPTDILGPLSLYGNMGMYGAGGSGSSRAEFNGDFHIRGALTVDQGGSFGGYVNFPAGHGPHN